jgi:hypothetical protein
VSEQFPHGNAAARFNARFAVKITNGVGTMWCADAVLHESVKLQEHLLTQDNVLRSLVDKLKAVEVRIAT